MSPITETVDNMNRILHITSGDCAGGSLAGAGLPGEVFVWHDILYDGPRRAGRPDEGILNSRALFLEQFTGGGLNSALVLETLRAQYRKLNEARAYDDIVLWFDACLFDQSMLVHILACLFEQGIRDVMLLCVDSFPGIVPYHGLGQLTPAQLASLYNRRCQVTDSQFSFAVLADKAFALRDPDLLIPLSEMTDAPLPWIPAAVKRLLQEFPDPETGLGLLENLALSAVRAGHEKPAEIFAYASAADAPPQFWGDTTLWTKINALAQRVPPLVRIEGPAVRLPQWESMLPLENFRIITVPGRPFTTVGMHD